MSLFLLDTLAISFSPSFTCFLSAYRTFLSYYIRMSCSLHSPQQQHSLRISILKQRPRTHCAVLFNIRNALLLLL